MNRALLQVIIGSIVLARGDLAAAAQSVLTARDALRSARYEDQHQLPLARLEILFALAKDGPAAALATASQVMDRFELSGSSPRYAWPVVIAGASAVLAAARLAGVSRDERLRDEAAAIADRLRTVAEKLETFGPAQRACRLTFAAADADAAHLLAAFAGAGAGDAEAPGAGRRAPALTARPPGCSPPGIRPPPRGPASASHIRSARRCCTRRRRRWPAATATPRRNGCSARSRWRPGSPRARSASRSRSWRGAPGSGWPRRRRRPGARFRPWRARPHRTRTRGAPPGRGRAQQQGDSRRAVHLAQDGQRPRVQHPRQAERGQPRRGRRQGAHPPPLRPHQHRVAAASNDGGPLAAALGPWPGGNDGASVSLGRQRWSIGVALLV